ncbi:MAG TPA: hypothetical protein VK631_21640 [Solirubrobacteraceae bacterium]|nr:hypothetical protein [Solirubrobacteraceae bacterium]
MIYSALTPDLMQTRLLALRVSVFMTTGVIPSPEDLVLFSTLKCDGCRTTLDPAETPNFSGWTTSGDLMHGFVDHCPDCSA